MTTTHEAAAERPPEPNFEIVDDTGEVWCWCKTEEGVSRLSDMLNEYERERDSELIDEAFAKSVGREENLGWDLMWHIADEVYIRRVGMGQMMLTIRGDTCELIDPTIGQFWTACRLFGVSVKEAK